MKKSEIVQKVQSSIIRFWHERTAKRGVETLLFWSAIYLSLSWSYALIEQIAFPVPLSPVPVILQPLPLFFLSLALGWSGALSFGLYLLQGAIGLPFFAFAHGGLARLMGPTGGYLIGMFVASCFLATTRKYFQRSYPTLLMKIIVANLIVYAFGLAQLSLFISFDRLFLAGFWPFIPGCLIKIVILCSLAKSNKKWLKIV